jgi:UDP-N-acetylglucosamine 2-epimerase (non-hydrolysing)
MQTDTSRRKPVIMPVFGTRPEAIKMFPVVHALKARATLDTRLCISAQHRQMLDQVLAIAGLTPDIDLDIMQKNQSLDELLARLVTRLGEVFDRERPDRILVHGDTLTTMAASLAAYFRQIPVGHVEAGLRSGNIYHPWPEEVNRKVTATVADLNFAPTETAANALRMENVPADRIFVTGNTVIDALLSTRSTIAEKPELTSDIGPVLARFAGKRIIAVTSHRRENFGEGMRAIAEAVRTVAAHPGTAIIFPVHPNPNVRPAMEQVLDGIDNVALIDPLDYPNFVALLDHCHIVLTDSGGVQEEAPSLGKPVLVMRDTTERPEGIKAGTASLVGSDKDRIVEGVLKLLDDEELYRRMATAHNPFGDGKAAERIADIVENFHVGQS